jgi:gluconate kinase
MKLAESLKHVVYLDKDSLVPLSEVAFKVAGQPVDRESEFFQKNLRDVEYQVTLDLAFQAITYDDIVLINAPFKREVHDQAYMEQLRDKLKKEYNASLTIIWVKTSLPIVHQRMIERNSPRDIYKLKDWDAYVKTQDFEIPSYLSHQDKEDRFDFLVFNNDNEEQFKESMTRILSIIEKEETDR